MLTLFAKMELNYTYKMLNLNKIARIPPEVTIKHRIYNNKNKKEIKMKSILTLTLAIMAITTMGSKTYKTNTIKFSGEKYFTFIDNNRYDTLQDRFNQLCLVKQKTKVFTNKINNTWCVTVNDKVLISVTKQDAILHNSNPKLLANKWAYNLSKNIEDIKPLK